MTNNQNKQQNNQSIVKFKPKQFQMRFIKPWNLFEKLIKDKKNNKKLYEVAHKLAERAKPFTNSLEPISDESTIRELSKEFKISVRDVKQTFDDLFDLGVIASFEVANKNNKYEKFYIFNPYLSFNGNEIPIGILELFKNTIYADLS